MTPVTHHEHDNAPHILRASRTGSALLIVVGTLAIIAVFAAIYIAIGQGDQRVARSIESRNATTDATNTIADHLADVIAIDREALVTRRTSLTEDTLFAERETTDAPYTDYTMRSESANAWELFNPQGSHDPTQTNGIPTSITDFRVASDPWLASTTPTYLGDPGQPTQGGTADLRPFGKLIQSADPSGHAANAYASSFLDNRDWRQISNFGPDGRPVNLYNLRPNRAFNDNTLGSFDAEPGVGTTNRNGRDIRRMSEHLTLWNLRDDDPLSPLIAFDPDTEGIWLQGRNDPTPRADVWQTNVPADLANVPAVWTMNQRFAFLPLNQPFVTYNRQNQVSSWADPDYPAYQWADADGDGMADSRWFELVAARDPAEGSSTNPRADIERNYDAGRARVFFAARAVDLSSKVNVNTATDLLAIPEPDQGAPLGATPADVDLRRLLSMQDAAENYSTNSQGGLSPKFFHRPPSTRRNDLLDTDYFNYQARIDNPSAIGTITPVVIEPSANTLSVGRYAYDAIKRSIVESRVLDERYFALPPETRRPNPGSTIVAPQAGDYDQLFNSDQTLDEIADAYPSNLDPTGEPLRLGQKFLGTDTAVERRDYYRNNILAPSTNNNAAIYGENDLAELLTYHGLNDPNTLSRLEKAALGRMPSLFGLNHRAYTPLFSNRPLNLDRTRHGLVEVPPRYAVETLDTFQNRDITGVMSKESMAFFTMSPRQFLTTLSGSVPLTQGYTVYPPINGDATPTTLDSTEQALAAAEAAPSLSSVINNANTAFDVYANALAAELDARRLPTALTIDSLFVTDLSTRRSDATAAPFATLFYGHRGPELALRIAAHSAVNMKDLADSDSNPTIATLIIDNEPRDDLEDTNSFPDDDMDADPTDALYQDYPGKAQGNFFDLGETNLPGTAGSAHLPTPKRRALNIYGVEAMPVITEVATLAVFHDMSENAGAYAGDPDYGLQRPRFRNGLPPIIPLAGTQTKITINPDRDSVNSPDCLMEVVAFQLHNPFDNDISLGGSTIPVSDDAGQQGVPIGPNAALTRHRLASDTNQIDTNANYQFDHYIEWNGYFFKLAEFSQYYPPSSSISDPIDPRDLDQDITGVNNPAIDFPENVVDDPMNGGSLVDAMNDPLYPDFMARNVILGAGETRTFYAVVDHRFNPTNEESESDIKWRAALAAYGQLDTEFTSVAFDFDGDTLPDGFDGRGWTGPAREWIESQLTTSGSRPVLIHPMNPQTGEYLDPTQVYDYLDGGALNHADASLGLDQLSTALNRRVDTEVRLWRKIVTPAEETRDTNFTSSTSVNILHNDMLVDRLAITNPYPEELLVDPGTNEVLKTASFAEDYPSTANELAADVRNDNTGYTVIRWSSTSRADSQDNMIPGIGQVREWMLSSRTNPTNLKIDVQDRSDEFGANAGEFTNDDVIDAGGADLDDVREPIGQVVNGDVPERLDYEVHRRLGDLFDYPNSVISTIAFDPYEKSDLATNVADNASTFSVEEKFNRDPATPAPAGSGLVHPGGVIASLHAEMPASRETDLRPEVITNTANFNNAPRLADLLLTLGIGPAYAPDDSLTDANASYYADEWMTLPEALAIALGYENPAAGLDAVESVWNDTFLPGDEALDEGRLAIDNYVAYINATISENPPEFTYDEDIRRGTGAPMALGVIDAVRPFDVTGIQNALTTTVPGTININTAPVEVLRLLPGLSPSTTEYYTDSISAGSRAPEWWGSDPIYELPNLSQPVNPSNPLLKTPDVAALVQGYRDRTWVRPRARSMLTLAGLEYDNSPVNYAPSQGSGVTDNTIAFGANLINEIPQIFNGDMTDHRDRQSMSGIEGIRQTPGFGSLGEILAVTFSDDATGLVAGSPHMGRSSQLDIQQYGFDDLNLDGMDPTEVAIDPQLFGGSETGITIDDHAERLAIANGILNTITVRSDYFAVWFVMHVYQPGDVENLQPQDPLIPSVAKRFLMVVDRSNVTRPGDSPRIVLFREVPM